MYAGFEGNSHVVFKGAFFYKPAHSRPRIIKYHLFNETSQVLYIPGLTSNNSKSLYRFGKNVLDFSVDENGLWVMFAVPDSKNMAVMKVS